MAIILGALVKRTNSKDAALDDRRDRLEAERKDKQEKLAHLYRAIEVGKEKIRIIGDTNVLAGVVSGRKDSPHNVRGYVRNWRTSQEMKPRILRIQLHRTTQALRSMTIKMAGKSLRCQKCLLNRRFTRIFRRPNIMICMSSRFKNALKFKVVCTNAVV
jgi:hypothetical protein